MSTMCGYSWPTEADVETAVAAGVPAPAVELMKALPQVVCARTVHADHLHVTRSFPTLPFAVGGLQPGDPR